MQYNGHINRIKGRRVFSNPTLQIHPTHTGGGDHQSKLTLMSESLRNDGRIWVPKKQGDNRKPGDIPEDEKIITWKEDTCVWQPGSP